MSSCVCVCVCVSVCIYMGVHMSGVVCIGEISKYYGRFCCMFMSRLRVSVFGSMCLCAHVCTGRRWKQQRGPQKFVKMRTPTHTHTHNKHTSTASGERVCDLEGDNFVARPHRRQLSTE